MSPKYTQLMESPVGSLLISANEDAITGLTWAKTLPLGFMETPNAVTTEAVAQLKDYFTRDKQSFDLKIEFNEGTPFQQQVWQALLQIPFGKTISYKTLAEQVGSAPRAVGGAVGANPVPILVPCHRVVGENGMLTGFSGGDGIPTKIKLLELEGAR